MQADMISLLDFSSSDVILHCMHEEEASLQENMERLTVHDWYCLSQGFSRITWSIPLGLALLAGIMTFEDTDWLPLPSYVLAVSLFCWGLITLSEIDLPLPRWKSHLRAGYLISFMLFYYAPFVFWGQRLPTNDHLCLNMISFVMMSVGGLWLINRLIYDLGIFFQDPQLKKISRWMIWAVILMTMVPLLLITLWVIWVTHRDETHIYWALMDMRVSPFQWVISLMFLPVVLTWWAGLYALQEIKLRINCLS